MVWSMRRPIPSQSLQFTVQDQHDCYFNLSWHRLVFYLSKKCVFLLSDKQSYIDFICLVFIFLLFLLLLLLIFLFLLLLLLLLLILQSFDRFLQLSIWNCCKPFSSLPCNCQLLCFWRLALIIVVEVFPRPFFFADVASSGMFTTNLLYVIVFLIHEWHLFFKFF